MCSWVAKMSLANEITAVGYFSSAHVGTIVRTACWGFGMREFACVETPDDFMAHCELNQPEVALVQVGGDASEAAGALLHRLRHDPASSNPFLPVIALSSYARRADVLWAINLGFHEFVTLPLSVRALWRAVNHSVFIGRPFVRGETYFGPCRRRRTDAGYVGPERRESGGGSSARADQEARMDRMLANAG